MSAYEQAKLTIDEISRYEDDTKSINDHYH